MFQHLDQLKISLQDSKQKSCFVPFLTFDCDYFLKASLFFFLSYLPQLAYLNYKF